MSFVVRPCAPRDLKDIMRLVKEIAVIYNVPLETLRTNVQELEKDGFGPRPRFECFVAEVPPERKSKEGHTLVGYILSSYTYNSWKGKNLYMDNFYVMPEFRAMRIGNSLLNEAAKAAWQQGCSELRMHVFFHNPNNTAFLERRGGENLTVKEGWNLLRFYEDRLRKMADQSQA
ncbi:diamine acetyltransferase 1-like [Python bivittatus]|uniref:Diamine acetyltransferase 1-like n=1 Tax=Python bivittatus TaxID=176946 RepID=A0A9F5N756_PYTBI|nr:diamine acetyltransferase 1-like [Python bivittatus]